MATVDMLADKTDEELRTLVAYYQRILAQDKAEPKSSRDYIRQCEIALDENKAALARRAKK